MILLVDKLKYLAELVSKQHTPPLPFHVMSVTGNEFSIEVGTDHNFVSADKAEDYLLNLLSTGVPPSTRYYDLAFVCPECGDSTLQAVERAECIVYTEVDHIRLHHDGEVSFELNDDYEDLELIAGSSITNEYQCGGCCFTIGEDDRTVFDFLTWHKMLKGR